MNMPFKLSQHWKASEALSVFYSHFFYQKYFLDPNYEPNSLWGHLDAAHSSVLLFFILSGYVIALTNQGVFTQAKAKKDLLRRLVRLYPIYLVALAISLLAYHREALHVILTNASLLQNLDNYGEVKLPPLAANPPLWRLNYEVLYYLLFLLVWWRRFNLLLLIGALVGISALQQVTKGFPDFVCAYSAGFVF